MITLTLHSPATPDAVLASLRARGGAWRPPGLPGELRRAGVSAVTCTVVGDTATLTYDWQRPGPNLARAVTLRAAVRPGAAGGSAVEVRGGYDLRLGPSAAVVGLAVVLAAVPFGVGALALLAWGGLLLGAAYAIGARAQSRLTRAGSPAAEYLVRRLEEVVAAAGQASVVAPAR